METNGSSDKPLARLRTVTAHDLGLSEDMLIVLREMMEGTPDPELKSHWTKRAHTINARPHQVHRLAGARFIEAVGEDPEDGFAITAAGRQILREAGTFTMPPDERVEYYRRTEWRAAPPGLFDGLTRGLVWLGIGAALASAVMWLVTYLRGWAAP